MSHTRSLIALLGWSLVTPAFAWFDSNNAENQPQPQIVQPNPEILDLVSRTEQLQSEIQQLRGMLEEQSQTISDLQRKQKNMYLDLDNRIQAAGASAPQAVPGATPSTPVAAPAQAVGQSAQATPVAVPAQMNQPATTQTNVTSAPVSTVTPSGNEKDRYQQAYEALRGGQNAMAVKLFESFLLEFSGGQFADNAQYWLAEAYKVNREIDRSKAAFIKVITQYPQSAKVPDALLKLGYIEFELQNIPKSREYLTQVVNAFPGTPAANLAGKKLATMP